MRNGCASFAALTRALAGSKLAMRGGGGRGGGVSTFATWTGVAAGGSGSGGCTTCFGSTGGGTSAFGFGATSSTFVATFGGVDGTVGLVVRPRIIHTPASSTTPAAAAPIHAIGRPRASGAGAARPTTGAGLATLVASLLATTVAPSSDGALAIAVASGNAGPPATVGPSSTEVASEGGAAARLPFLAAGPGFGAVACGGGVAAAGRASKSCAAS